MKKKEAIPVELIERKILLIRGQKVMLDGDLASLYEVETSNLNKAVKRNIDRFPEDFMFQLSKEEAESLRFQTGILKPDERLESQLSSSKKGRGAHRKYLPYVFTEQGVAMLSGILRSQRAIHVNIAIMRAFVKLREFLSTHKELAHKLSELERKIERHDEEIKAVFNAIRQLMIPPEPKRRQIGFHRERERR